MRLMAIGSLLVLLAAGPALAQTKLPKNVYPMAELEKALAEAKEKGKPVSFIYASDFQPPPVTCARMEDVSGKMLEGLDHKSIVVHIPMSMHPPQLPALLFNAIREPDGSVNIPVAVVTDAQLSQVYAVVPRAIGQELDKSLRKARKAMPKPAGKEGAAAPLPADSSSTIPEDETRDLRAWQGKTGTKIVAALVEETGEFVILKKEDGTKVKVSKDNLSPPDQDYLDGVRGRDEASP